MVEQREAGLCRKGDGKMNRKEINRSEKFNRSNFGPVYEDFAFWFIIAGVLKVMPQRRMGHEFPNQC